MVTDPGSAILPSEPVRLATLLAPLSIISDMGLGAPDETAMRTCLLATSLARRLKLAESDVAVAYYATLLKHLGCTATAYEEARMGGNELHTRSLIGRTDMSRPTEMVRMLVGVGRGRGPIGRATTTFRVATGKRFGRIVQQSVCEAASMMAGRLGMGSDVSEALSLMYSRWDGKGVPRGIGGESIPIATRIAQVAERAIASESPGGVDAALAAVRHSAGGWLDPEVGAALQRSGTAGLAEAHPPDVLAAVLDAEPEPRRFIEPGALETAARAFGDMADLKMPFTVGHSPGVAALVQGAAERQGLGADVQAAYRCAGLLHDVGRVGISAGLWGKTAALSAREWEQLRLHPYYTERVLARAPALAPLARIAGMHHERLDGSGYHRGAVAREIPAGARLLAAADAYQTMIEERPHRRALAADVAAERLQESARRGEFDAEAVAAILEVAGQAIAPVRREWPGGLTEREVGVLRLVARGRSNREIAEHLVISRRTAEHHVAHIYDKIGVSTRAGATMFAMQHDLVAPPDAV